MGQNRVHENQEIQPPTARDSFVNFPMKSTESRSVNPDGSKAASQRGQINIPSVRRVTARRVIQALASIAPAYFASRIKEPCFLIGCPRSGTSLIEKLLGTHPSVFAYPSEALDLWHPQAFPWRKAAREADFPPLWADPVKFTAYSRSHRGQRYGQIIRSSFGACVVLAGGRRLVHKTTMIGLMLPDVLELFPDASFVHIVRDGRAVALSWAKRQREEIDRSPEIFRLRNRADDLHSLLCQCGGAWSTIVDRIDQDLMAMAPDPNRWMELRYEQFCAAPADTLAELSEFLHLPAGRFDGSLVDSVQSQNDKFVEELSDRDSRELHRHTHETLERKGFLAQA